MSDEPKDRDECKDDMKEVHKRINSKIELRLFLFVVALFISIIGGNIKYTYSVDSEAATKIELNKLETNVKEDIKEIKLSIEKTNDKLDRIERQMTVGNQRLLDAIRER